MSTQLAQHLDITTLRRLRDHDAEKVRALVGKPHKQAALRQYRADLDRLDATLAACEPETRRVPQPCPDDGHIGPLIDTERFEEFAERQEDEFRDLWRGCGTCARCLSTIHRDNLRVAA